MEAQQEADEVDPHQGSDVEDVDDDEQQSSGFVRPMWGAKEPLVTAQFPYLTEEAPDLREYFAQFPNVTPAEQVSICRAYSSYVSSCGRAGRGATAKAPGPKPYPYKRGRYATGASGSPAAKKRGRFS